jgi:hypothetical protein
MDLFHVRFAYAAVIAFFRHCDRTVSFIFEYLAKKPQGEKPGSARVFVP